MNERALQQGKRLGLGGRSSLLLVLPLVAVVVLLFVLPFGQMLWISFTQPEFGFEHYEKVFASDATRNALIRTIRVSLIVTVIAVLVGMLLAWELVRSRSRLKRGIIWGVVLFAMWVSTVVRNYAFTLILQRTGIVNETLLWLGIIEEPVDLLYSEFAVVLGMLHMMIPYATLPIFATLTNVPPQLITAAQSLGASTLRAFVTVVLPLISRAILAAATIIFVMSIGFYITPVLLGGAQSPFIASLIGDYIFRVYNLPFAATLGTVIFVVGVVMIVIAWRVSGGATLKRMMR